MKQQVLRVQAGDRNLFKNEETHQETKWQT